MPRPRPGRRPLIRVNPVVAPCSAIPGGCEVHDLFRILGKAHMLDLLHVFLHGEQGKARRFVELQERLDISPNTLSDRLKELVEAGLLQRTAYSEIPPRVDYVATAKAVDLKPVFDQLAAWAAKHNLQPASAQEPARA